ncbi:uncharacterized protein LOC119486911 [Sebastes umbrosus]|uniref:uncharacterized protein LOC119486911 n=1 Tax=Sebastes umbrosus TaxID=72105 RepID=UPI0018A0D9B2|nr:uncharacterized protein LOC119486911 [Sebastes umbrosus]
MSVQLGLILQSVLVISESPSMHGLPCSSLGHCFGNPSDVNTDPTPAQEEPNNSRQSRNNHGLPAAGPVISQPEALPRSPLQQQHRQPQRTISCISDHSTRTIKVNGVDSNSICRLQDTDDAPCFESPPALCGLSQSSEEDELEVEFSPELELKYPHIPRPSIIIRQPKESEFQETASDRSDGRETEDGGLSGTENNTSFLLSLLSPLPSPTPALAR